MTTQTNTEEMSDGFTLVELLIAIAVMGAILPALAAAFYVSINTVEGTTDRVAGSSAASLAATKFGPDVQSAVAVTTAAAWVCPPDAGSPLLTTTNKDGVAAIWYSTGDSLARRACADGSTWTVPLAPDSDITVTCLPAGCPPGFTEISLQFTPLEGEPVVLRSARRNS